MRQFSAALYVSALVVLALATRTAAQIPGYPNGCPTCYTIGAVDTPQNGDTVSSSAGFVGGWGYQVIDGGAVDRVDVWTDIEGAWRQVLPAAGNLYYGLFRSDMAALGMPANTGWMWFSWGSLPVGCYDIQVHLWHGPLMAASVGRSICVVP